MRWWETERERDAAESEERGDPMLKRWPRRWRQTQFIEEQSHDWGDNSNNTRWRWRTREEKKHVLITLMSIVNILNQFVWWICLMNVSMTWYLFDIFSACVFSAAWFFIFFVCIYTMYLFFFISSVSFHSSRIPIFGSFLFNCCVLHMNCVFHIFFSVFFHQCVYLCAMPFN